MNIIAEGVEDYNVFEISRRGSKCGFAWVGGRHDMQEMFSEIKIIAQLAKNGLKLKFRAISKAQKREGDFYIGWEALIMRYPQFLKQIKVEDLPFSLPQEAIRDEQKKPFLFRRIFGL